jgi:hypothetical protein
MCFKVEIGSVSSKQAYSAELKKHMYLSKENHLCLKVQQQAHRFPVRTELVFERSTSCNSEFSRWLKDNFVPNRPFQLSWRNTCIRPMNTICVRSDSIYHLTSLWNFVSFWMEFFLQLWYFKVYRLTQLSWRNTGNSSKKKNYLS